MSSRRSRLAFTPLLAVTFLASCKGAEKVCDPTDPLCGGGGGATVATVTVTSPTVDTVMAVGHTAQLTAAAKDASSSPVSVTFTWASQTPSVIALTSASGASAVFTAAAAGSATIHVTQDKNAVAGDLKMRAVDADLTGLTSTLGDAFSVALRNALTATPKTAVTTQLASCASNVTSGNLLAIKACLTNLKAVSSSDPTDQALLGVLQLFFNRAQVQLQL
jgi:hypothetical protein